MSEGIKTIYMRYLTNKNNKLFSPNGEVMVRVFSGPVEKMYEIMAKYETEESIKRRMKNK